jgi:DNA-binding transcriptional regulator/RsmH inhibitor MraZ
VPEYLKDFAKMESEILFVGVDRYVEVWSKEIWKTQEQQVATQIQEIAQKVVGSEHE